MELKDIKFDKRNYRKHGDKNKELIKKSVTECGFGRSIVIDSENEIIGGNGVVGTLDKDTKIKVIETDGSELVVVKRTDLKTEDEKRKRLAVLDNSTSDSSEFDLGLLQEDFDVGELGDLGIDLPEIETDEEESKYTRKVTIPIYEIKGENPQITEMVDTEKADELAAEIEHSNISDEDKEFLKKTATRLFEFRYDKIAEYYAHADKETQELMEKLALVIIDFDKAIEYGYIQLNKFIEKNFMEENNID